MGDRWIPKGARVRVAYLAAKPLGTWSLSGCQDKAAVESIAFTGTVRHLRGNDPVSPTEIRLYVEPEAPVPGWLPRTRAYGCACDHGDTIEVRPEGVVEVLDG